MHDWISLTTRLGASISNPSPSQLQEALEELLSSKLDDEHPDCWIECGSEGGELHTLSIFQSGKAIYTKYSDADMSEELESKILDAPTVVDGLRVWECLIGERYGEL